MSVAGEIATRQMEPTIGGVTSGPGRNVNACESSICTVSTLET